MRPSPCLLDSRKASLCSLSPRASRVDLQIYLIDPKTFGILALRARGARLALASERFQDRPKATQTLERPTMTMMMMKASKQASNRTKLWW